MRRTHLIMLSAVLVISAPRLSAQATGEKVASLFRDSYAAEGKRDYPAALAAAKQAKQLGAPAYFATMRIAWLAYLQGDFAASEAGYTEAIASSPRAVEPKLGITLPLLAAKKWSALERACRDVLALDPQNALALGRLGVAQYWSGNYKDAITTYQGLMAAYPAELDYQTGLGWALLKGGRAAEAKPLFDAVLKVSPDNASAKLGLTGK